MATSAGSPVARKRTRPSARASESGAAGPGVSSWMGQSSGVTTSSGVAGWPSRMVSRKPWTAGAKVRSRMPSRFTTLMPTLTLTRSAGVSRMARAVNGSSSAPPPNPRLTRSTPPRRAATAGHVVAGLAAFEPWLIELPWCTHTGRSLAGAGSTGASVRRAMTSVTSVCGNQISMALSRSGRPSKRTVPGSPSMRVAAPVVMSMVSVDPPLTDPRAAGCPSTSRS